MTLGALYWRSWEKRDRRAALQEPSLSSTEEGGVSGGEEAVKAMMVTESSLASSSSSREGLVGKADSQTGDEGGQDLAVGA